MRRSWFLKWFTVLLSTQTFQGSKYFVKPIQLRYRELSGSFGSGISKVAVFKVLQSIVKFRSFPIFAKLVFCIIQGANMTH